MLSVSVGGGGELGMDALEDGLFNGVGVELYLVGGGVAQCGIVHFSPKAFSFLILVASRIYGKFFVVRSEINFADSSSFERISDIGQGYRSRYG